MKKLLILVPAILLCLFGCYEDKGNYNYIELPEFLVDTAGQQTSFTVTQFNTLQAPSLLRYAGDKSKLTYTWSIYRSGSGQSTVPVDTLATTENLDVEIRVTPGSYRLEFCAIDATTGLRAMMQYDVAVEGAVGTGLLVFYETASGGADCDVVKSTLFDASLTNETILRGVYSLYNPGRPLAGRPVGCALTSASSSRHIYLFTESDGVKLYTDDMTIMMDFQSMFFTAPEVCKPQGIYGGSLERFFNNGKLHTCLVTWSGSNAPRLEMEKVGADYEAAPYMLNTYGSNTLFYDNRNTRFLFSTMYGGTALSFTAKGDAFAFDNVGKKMIYMALGYGSNNYTGYCIMRNEPDDAERYIYPVDASVSAYTSYTALPVLDISGCTDIANATAFAFAQTGPIVFYSVGSKIHQVNYDWSTATVSGSTEVWDFGGAEVITMLKRYSTSVYLVATWNASANEGKIYALEADIVNGRLTSEPLGSFDGFGKVKDVVYKNI
ncbi:MAG: hypothetical protein LBD64_00195 [Odoribacteraceae bacterium]|jgi:hypothetical protein|nr:hypothetical protein [Odoribacteraceae bacterium]